MPSTKVPPSKVNLAEKDIEDWLFENPEEIKIIGRPVSGWIGRQIELPSGIADLIGWVSFGDRKIPVVVEIKNVEPTADALTQVCRYAEDISETLAYWDYYAESEVNIWKIVVHRGSPSTKLIHEANAVGVLLYSFDVELSLSVSGYWKFSKEYSSEIDGKRNNILESGILDIFYVESDNAEISEPKTEGE